MHHPEIDPSLRAAEPPLDTLADGFSPPAEAGGEDARDDESPRQPELPLASRSPF